MRHNRAEQPRQPTSSLLRGRAGHLLSALFWLALPQIVACSGGGPGGTDGESSFIGTSQGKDPEVTDRQEPPATNDLSDEGMDGTEEAATDEVTVDATDEVTDEATTDSPGAPAMTNVSPTPAQPAPAPVPDMTMMAPEPTMNAGPGTPVDCETACLLLEMPCGSPMDDCLRECQQDADNAASCGQEGEWLGMLACCLSASWDTCNEASFDACQIEACGELRPEGAAEGCSPWCGDGSVQEDSGEECDDGNAINEDACTNECQVPTCGDGFTQEGEECDDGNTLDSDECTSECLFATCGDGYIQPGESCDDGNDVDDDSCTNDCRLASCGNGALDDGEQCDDGNTEDDDGCSSHCILEPAFISAP